MFNLQANAFDIAKGIKEDLDMELHIKVFLDPFCDIKGVGLKVEHIFSFFCDPLHQKLIKDRCDPYFDI